MKIPEPMMPLTSIYPDRTFRLWAVSDSREATALGLPIETGADLRIVMGRDMGDAQRRVLLSVFPKAQHGQRQIRASIVEARGDWRDALTRVLEGLAA